VLVGWRNQYGRNYNRFLEANDGIAFATTTNESMKKNKGKKKKVTCYKCKQEGHYSNECPEEEEDKPEKGTFNKKGTSLLMKTQKNDKSDESNEETEDSSDKKGFAFLQQDVVCSIQEEAAIPKTWIFLDSQSTVDMFSNPILLSNICDAKKGLVLYCNAGKEIIKKKGDLKGYGTVWFYPDGIANILSLSNVQKKCKVMYDSTLNDGFLVHKADGTTWVFRPSKKGLFFSDVKDNVGHVFVNTVAKNKSKYIIKEYYDAV